MGRIFILTGKFVQQDPLWSSMSENCMAAVFIGRKKGVELIEEEPRVEHGHHVTSSKGLQDMSTKKRGHMAMREGVEGVEFGRSLGGGWQLRGGGLGLPGLRAKGLLGADSLFVPLCCCSPVSLAFVSCSPSSLVSWWHMRTSVGLVEFLVTGHSCFSQGSSSLPGYCREEVEADQKGWDKRGGGSTGSKDKGYWMV
jgi:hypothetical protein